MTAIGAQSADISGPAYTLINARASQNQSQFFVYEDIDSPFNHGFPSGLFGSSAVAMGKLSVNPSCVYSANAEDGCSTDPTAMDQTRGTVFQFTFAPLVSGEYVGLNFEEPQNWGANQEGIGYDLTGATQLVFDAICPTGGIQVQFSVNGSATAFMTIPQQWSTITINLSSLGLTSLTGVHLLFGIGSNDMNAPNGGTVLLDNIHFLPVPISQTTALGLPLANQVFGIEHVQNSLPGSIPIPPDQINSNLATLYESSLAIIALIDRGQPQDLTSAKLIADTLVYALGHDNQGDLLPAPGGLTGLHNGYYAGDIALFNSQGPQGGQQRQVRLSGFTAPVLCPQTGFCLVLDGATGGNNAFGILGLLAAYKQFQNSAYLNAALTIGDWIYGNLLDSSGTGYGGYFVGYPDNGLPKILESGKSTENNADIFAAFTALAGAESAAGNTSAAALWTSRANIAGDFVMQMYDSINGRFNAGTVSANPPSPPALSAGNSQTPFMQKGNDIINTFDFLDTETFTTLAMAPASRYQSQIDWHLPVQWVLSHFQSTVTATDMTFQGFDLIQASESLPSDGPLGIAWEFTGQEVATMKLVDTLYGTSQFVSPISTYLTQIQQAQSSAPFTDGQGVVASTLQNGDAVAPYNQCLVTPFQCIAERVGLAATIWGIAAEQGLDPFQLTALPAQLLQAITFGALGNQVLGTAPFTLSATSSSGLRVTFASNTPTVCTVSGITVTVAAVGTCSITASQAGNASYEAAAPVTQAFTITSGSINPGLVGAPIASNTFLGMCCDDNISVAAEFTLSVSAYVTTIDIVLLGNSIYDFTLQNSLGGSITTFARAVMTAPEAGPNTEAMTVNETLPAGTYYLVGTEDPASTLRVPGWYLSDGSTFVTTAGSVTNGVWSSNSGPAGPFSFLSGVVDGYTYPSPTFIVNGSTTVATASLSATPADLTFQAWRGAPAQSQTLQIGGTAGIAWQAAAATSSGGNWLSVSQGAGQIPAGLTVLVISGGLTPGTYQGSITVHAPAATPSSSTISVTLTVTAASGQSGIITTVAGNGFTGPNGDGGPATSATFANPYGVAVDASGNLFIADFNDNRIRKVSASGIITTVAGNGAPGPLGYGDFSGDGGPATSASLNHPYGVAVDASGNLFIADSGNNRIRKVSAGGIITTVAGNGPSCGEFPCGNFSGDGGPATSASLFSPYSVAVDASGNLFIADEGNNRIRKVSASGIITTVAGNGPSCAGIACGGFSGDGGAATAASLNSPYGVTVDASGNLFIADTENNRIRKVPADGMITTVAGDGPSCGQSSYNCGGFSGDGGPATSASLFTPWGVTVDAFGDLFIADVSNSRIRKVSASGIIMTVAGNGTGEFSGDGGPATSASLLAPTGIAVDASGDLFIADSGNERIRKVSASVTAAAPSINSGGIVPVDSTVATIQPGEWVSIYGSNLASSTMSWIGDFPTSLSGTSVTINGKAAYLSFVSPGQINLQAPNDTATGIVPVVVTTASGSSTATVTLAQFGPSFLLLDAKHVAGIIVRTNGAGAYAGGAYDIIGPTGNSLGYPTVAAQSGDVVELFGTGLGPTNPAVPGGQLFSGAAPTINPVNLLINNVNVTPSFAGLSGAGLYQINLTVPAGLGTGDVALLATVGGVQTPPNVVISLQ